MDPIRQSAGRLRRRHVSPTLFFANEALLRYSPALSDHVPHCLSSEGQRTRRAILRRVASSSSLPLRWTAAAAPGSIRLRRRGRRSRRRRRRRRRGGADSLHLLQLLARLHLITLSTHPRAARHCPHRASVGNPSRSRCRYGGGIGGTLARPDVLPLRRDQREVVEDDHRGLSAASLPV